MTGGGQGGGSAFRKFLERTPRGLESLAAKLGKRLRRGDPSGRGDGFPPAPSEQDDLSSAEPNTTDGAAGDAGFPGFAPAPGLADRFRASLAFWIDRLRNKPRVVLAGALVLVSVSIFILVLALAFRPPKPMSPRLSSNSSARELLSRIPIPRTDPLAEESTLDRPRKARYTETDVAQGWLDLGRLPTDELREKNRAELETLLSAMEKP